MMRGPLALLALAAFAVWGRRAPVNKRPRPANPFDYASFDREFDATWPQSPTRAHDLHFVAGAWRTVH